MDEAQRAHLLGRLALAAPSETDEHLRHALDAYLDDGEPIELIIRCNLPRNAMRDGASRLTAEGRGAALALLLTAMRLY